MNTSIKSMTWREKYSQMDGWWLITAAIPELNGSVEISISDAIKSSSSANVSWFHFTL